MAPRWASKKKKPPMGFDVLEPVLDALDNELRDKVKESNENKRKTESVWPVHQINWQKSRFVYDMFYTHQRITRKVYDYCIQQKLVDPALIAKWKKPGYERLCSTYVINPTNYKFNTTSICRVPLKDRGEEQRSAQDPTTGCMGCASGKGAGPRNVFGNKYGQNLAAVLIAREKRMEEMERKRRLHEQQQQQQQQQHDDGEDETDDDETDEDDDDDDDDYGPSPAAGVWAGSQKLQEESHAIETGEADEEDDDNDVGPMPKKLRTN